MLSLVGPYRPSRSSNKALNVLKTVIFLVAFWLVFLYIIPMGISILEIEVGIQRFPPLMRVAPIGLLVFSLISLWSALTLAVNGNGTPLPFDTASRFVTSGPFAFIRNPFMIATTGQGVSLGVALGSIPVIAYVAIMLIVWYFVIRPAEERDLEKRFGDRWRAYARAVRAARPRLTPYRQR